MTCKLLIVYRLVVSLSSLIVITDNIVICIYQTIIYDQETTNSEQVAYLRNLNYLTFRFDELTNFFMSLITTLSPGLRPSRTSTYS